MPNLLYSVGILLLLSAIGRTPANPQADASEAISPDSVDFVRLPAQRGLVDCPSNSHRLPVCRMRTGVDSAALRAALNTGNDVIADGVRLTFVRRSLAKSMQLTGGLQYPMSRVVGTDMYVVTLHVTDAANAIVSYGFFSTDEPLVPGTRIELKEWRGQSAPASPMKSTALAGILRIDTIESRNLSAPREVYSYVPPRTGNQPIAGVVYLGDGSSVQGVAPFLDSAIARGDVPPVILVGVATGMPAVGESPMTDVRAMEYLMNFEDGNRRFFAHERFVVDEIVPWAEKTLGAPRSASQRATWGVSNSGAWALDMVFRNPDVFSMAIAFSPGGRGDGSLPAGAREAPSRRILLMAGTLEPPFMNIADSWNRALDAQQVDHTYWRVVAGHDWLVWSERFVDAIRWAWRTGTRS